MKPAACGAGEATLPDGRCAPAGLPQDMPCPPGELALPSGACQAAGVPPDACGEGFAADMQGGCSAILPRQACPPGQMAIPGETTCREVAPCGQGAWGDIPIDADTQFVDPSYPGADSDGSQRRPWRTIQDGVDMAASGAVVAIAEGRYAETVHVVARPVRLWGKCPALVEVQGSADSPVAIAVDTARAAGTELRGIAVSAAQGAGVVLQRGTSATLEGLWIHGSGNMGLVLIGGSKAAVRASLIEQNATLGVFVSGSEATIDASVVRGSRPDAAGRFGRGISVQLDGATGQQGTLVLRRSLVDQNTDAGVLVIGSSATIESTVVRGTALDGAGQFGRGISVHVDTHKKNPSVLTLRSSVVEQNHEYGVMVEGSDAAVTSSVIRDTRPNGRQLHGGGIGVQHDPVSGKRGTLDLQASLIASSYEAGVTLLGSKGTLTSSVVRGTRQNTGAAAAEGVDAQNDPESGERSALDMRASVVEDNQVFGVAVTDSDATITSSVVRETQQSTEGRLSRGVGVLPNRMTGGRGVLVMQSSVIERSHGLGMFVGGSDATLISSVIRDTQSDSMGHYGRGLTVQHGLSADQRATIVLQSSLLERNREIGMLVSGADATLKASVIRDTQPDETGQVGRGLGVQEDDPTGERGTVVMDGSLIERNHDFGMYLSSADATITSSIIRATGLSPVGPQFGDGLATLGDRAPCTATIADSEFSENARAGLLLYSVTGSLDRVRSTGNRFGMVLQGESQPVIGDENLFEGNTDQDRLTAGNLSVPDRVMPVP